MKNRSYMEYLLLSSLLVLSTSSFAMGIRSLVALPLEQEGMVFRLQDIDNLDSDKNMVIGNFAYGITGSQTLLLGFPYRLTPGGTNRSGDLSVLYRYTAWQHDFAQGTYRLGLLGGGLVPTNNSSDGGAQAGAVATFYHGRHELDVDGLWGHGFGRSPNVARYDLAYQYRLTPAEYPETGLISEWDLDVEYNGRYTEGNNLVHQATLGLQWVHPRWVLESGLIQDISNPHNVQLLVSVRFHV